MVLSQGWRPPYQTSLQHHHTTLPHHSILSARQASLVDSAQIGTEAAAGTFRNDAAQDTYTPALHAGDADVGAGGAGSSGAGAVELTDEMVLLAAEEQEEVEAEEESVMLTNVTADGSVLKIMREEGYGQAAKVGDVVALRLWVSLVRMAPKMAPKEAGDMAASSLPSSNMAPYCNDAQVQQRVHEDMTEEQVATQPDTSEVQGEGSTCDEMHDATTCDDMQGATRRIACTERPKLLLKRDGCSDGERPVLVALRSSRQAGMLHHQGDDLQEVLGGLSEQVRQGVVDVLDLGVPDMLVGEIACFVVQLKRLLQPPSAPHLLQPPATTGGGGSPSASVHASRNASGDAIMCDERTEEGQMVQVEVEVLALNMQCVTQDGGILARFDHPHNSTQVPHDDNSQMLDACPSTLPLHTPPDTHRQGTSDAARIHSSHQVKGPCDSGDQGAHQDVGIHSNLEEKGHSGVEERRLVGEIRQGGSRPRAGDIAVVSYVMSYRGHVLMDLSEPHEVQLSVVPRHQGGLVDQDAACDMSDFPPGLQVLLCVRLRLPAYIHWSIWLFFLFRLPPQSLYSSMHV